jgi:hypothetical protein
MQYVYFEHPMNIPRQYNFTIAAILIVMYLALPTTIFAHAASIEVREATVQKIYSTTADSPCGDCPCSDGHGPDCCDTTFCNCACHAPLSQDLRIKYVPVIATQLFREPTWFLPQVYRTIFVPPQNPA